jgi:hypothetical protein
MPKHFAGLSLIISNWQRKAERKSGLPMYQRLRRCYLDLAASYDKLADKLGRQSSERKRLSI